MVGQPSARNGSADPVVFDPARVRAGVGLAVLVIGALSLAGAFATSAGRSVTYVASMCASALAVLLVAQRHPRQARAWRLVGAGLTCWAASGFLTTVRVDAGVHAIPSWSVSLCLAVGYVPLLLGLAELCDPQLRARRFTSAVDGVLLFVTLYGVLWLTLVAEVVGSSDGDRSFAALYPAGDLAVVMLAVRVVASRAARQRVGLLLLAGAAGVAISDVAAMVLSLTDPGGSYPLLDLLFLGGLGCFALASVYSLLPAPPPVTSGADLSRLLAVLVAAAALMPPVLLVAIVRYSERTISHGPVALWLLAFVGASVLRHVVGVKELEHAHERALWLASHDFDTELLGRSAFLHEVSAGSLRDRIGTVLVVEAQGLQELRDAHGYEAVDAVMRAVAQRLRAVAGEHAVLARLAHDQVVAVVRGTELTRGRELGTALQHSLEAGVAWGELRLPLPAIVGVAQADGSVIDVLAGVRRAVGAIRHGRLYGAGHVAVDADLTGAMVTR